MIEPKAVTEKFFNKETYRLIGEYQLQLYSKFLDKYNLQLKQFQKKLSNLHNIRSQVIILENKAVEDISLLELIQSDNKLLSRILVSLGALCEELSLLINEVYNNYYVSFIFYGEEPTKGTANLLSISKLMEKLQKVNFFVNRSQHVIIVVLKQLCAILGKNLYNESTVTCFPEPLDYLAELFVCLITLDSICGGLLQEHWVAYRKAVRLTLHNPSQFQIPLEQLRSLKECIVDIEIKLLRGNIFQQTMEKCLDEGLVVTMKNCSLTNEILLYIHQMLNELEKDDENMFFNQIWLQVNAMFVLHYYLFGNMDKKVYKRLNELNKRIAACVIVGNIVWYPEVFLTKHIPSLNKNLDIKLFANSRLALMASRSQNLPKEAHQLCVQSYVWMNELMQLLKIDMTHLQTKYLHNACNILINGIKLVKKISDLIKWITNLHADAERPMTKSTLLALCKLMEVLKATQFIFQKKLMHLVYVILLISQHLTYKALLLLNNIKKGLTQEKFYKEQQLDVLSSLNVAELSLKGPNTSQRILVAKLALSASGLSAENLSEVRFVINRLEMICSFRTLLYKLCNCSFLYWHQVLLPVYFAKLIDYRIDLSRFYLLLDSLNDCNVIAGEKAELATKEFLKNDILNPLNQLVETNLRLQTHLHLQLPPSNPFQNPPPSNFKHIIPSPLGNTYTHIKEEVEHYLSAMFYNLTTVVLHDWRTYGEMRRLALLQYGLSTVEDNLPIQTLEQGLDVLEIMRNIQVFVVKYSYNLNNQFFIEEKSTNKHLNTINISHVANSIRTHGIGIMNTTVNFIYQFLQNKFYIFSQFMFDEQIKSRLLKDLKYFSDNKTEMYPYERAEKFNTGIKRLGLNAEGLSYLDLFRKLITHIGNAMGYIRMIRSGGRRCLADATCFIPDLKAVNQLNKLLTEEKLTESTKKKIEDFIKNVNNLVENFEEATEYFKLLVKVFIPTFQNSQNIHLKNFYIIVPPLTINFVEHLFVSKERLNKKNRSAAVFTDDGFAIGLAFIIKLLNQSRSLNSLHWFQSVQMKHSQDRKRLESQRAAASKDDDKLQQTLALTEKRLLAFEKEFQLLFYSFNSARIFFEH
ncbi:hypothetical protein RN001_015639 [Aquatica leii]|uniref:WASH complex subunit 4 n=1 Tax=Aquatica leii TaxID=1421715 RepID=A0AAN7SMQ8_9COLE|nr:hypothetical protein RN001_015639 [Aquatica leii]